MAAKFDKDGYLAGVTLTPQQMKQMLTLGIERYREDANKARSMAGYLGVTEEPPRKINKEAARFYVEESGGDPAKAQAAAQADGTGRRVEILMSDQTGNNTTAQAQPEVAPIFAEAAKVWGQSRARVEEWRYRPRADAWR